MKNVFDLIREAVRLIEVDRADEATTLLKEALDHEKTDKGGAKAFDSGGSNPPGPGQPGHP